MARNLGTGRGFGIGLVALATLQVGACARPEPVDAGLPTLYWSMTSQGAQVDANTARDMISAYRARSGLPPLRLDPDLQKLAEAEAAAMANADRPSRAQTVKNAVERLGFAEPEANLSAGYHTLAEAFSGWRDSPAHNTTLLAPRGQRMGIATAYAPGSKYKVYWALLVAQ